LLCNSTPSIVHGRGLLMFFVIKHFAISRGVI